MGHEVEDRGRQAQERAGAEAREHVAELADRGVGEHPLEIVLHGGDQAGHKRRRRPHDRHGGERVGAGHEKRCASRHEVDARCDHRRRVDQGAGGRGAFHRVGEPDMQRQLGALAAGCEQETQADRRAHRAPHDAARIGEPSLAEDARQDRAVRRERVVEVERAIGHPEEKRRDRQAEVTHAVDEKRFLRGPRRLGLREPEADEQIAARAHRLPEHVHDEEVARRHEHRHREHEQREHREKPRIARIVVHVAHGIDRHHETDAGDDREQGGRERIEPQGDGNRERPRGAPRAAHRCAGKRRGASFRRHVGILHRGPLPERGDHLDRPHRFGVGAVGRAHLVRRAEQERHSHRGGRGDAGDGRQVGPRAEQATQEEREHGPGERQERHEHEECGGGE